LGRGGRGNPGRASFAQDADHRRLLFDHRHDDLRLDRAVLEGSHNGALHFDLGASGRVNGTRIGDRDVAAEVDGLVRNVDEIAGPHAAFGRNEETSGRSFEDRHAQDIADAEGDVTRPRVLLEGAQARQVPRQDLDDFRGNFDGCIIEADRVALTIQYIPG